MSGQVRVASNRRSPSPIVSKQYKQKPPHSHSVSPICAGSARGRKPKQQQVPSSQSAAASKQQPPRVKKCKHPKRQFWHNPKLLVFEEFIPTNYIAFTNKFSQAPEEHVEDLLALAKIETYQRNIHQACEVITEPLELLDCNDENQVKKSSIQFFIQVIQTDSNAIFDRRSSCKFSDVKDVLSSSDENLKSSFMDFLKNEKNEELYDFWEAVQNVRECTDPEEIEDLNLEIFENFLAEGAGRQISMDARLVNVLISKLDNPQEKRKANLFKELQQVVRVWLDFHFVRYKQSDAFFEMELENRTNNVARWKRSFSDIIHDDQARKVFLKFLEQERSEENLYFWMACEKLKTRDDKKDIEKDCKEIFQMFIGEEEDSACPPESMDDFDDIMGGGVHSGNQVSHVNLDWKTRERLAENLRKRPSKDMFDQAQKAVFHTMADDCFQRFKNSDLLQRYVDAVKINHNDQVKFFTKLKL